MNRFINLVWLSLEFPIPDEKRKILQLWSQLNPTAQINLWYASSLIGKRYYPREDNIVFLNIEDYSNISYINIYNEMAGKYLAKFILGYLIDLTKVLAMKYFLNSVKDPFLYISTDFDFLPYDVRILDSYEIGFRSYWSSFLTPENNLFMFDKHLPIIDILYSRYWNTLQNKTYLEKGTDTIFLENYTYLLQDYKRKLESPLTEPDKSKVATQGLPPLKEYHPVDENTIRTWVK